MFEPESSTQGIVMQLRNLKRIGLTLVILGMTGCQTTNGVSGNRSLSTTEWGYSHTTDIARAGETSQRFELRPGDCGRDTGWSDCASDRSRSEISVRQRWRYGTNKWIGFSVYLPEDFQTSRFVNTTVGQIHQRGGPKGTAGGFKSMPPLMQMEMKGNNYRLCVHMLSGDAGNVRDVCRYMDLMKVSDMRGKWTDIMINFDTSDDRQILDVYVNNTKTASISDWIRFKASEYYLKYGLYNSFISRNGGLMPTQVLYIDEIRMADSAEGVRVNETIPVD